MNKMALNKDIFKEIAKSKTRFLSIMVMIALGSFIFVGLYVTGPTMRNTLITYTDKYDLEDLSVTSPLGLELEDQIILSTVPGIKLLDYGYRTDLMQKDTDVIVRLESLGKLPKYEIVEGRLPKKNNEIALDSVMREKKYKLGDKLSFVREKAQSKYSLKNYDYTIVGFVNSPEYLMPDQKGVASVGDGVVDCFGVIPKADFDMENYTLARMDFKDVQGLNSYSDEYREKMKIHREEVEHAFASRPEIRLQKYHKDGIADISTAEGKITDAERKLIDAKKKLVTGRNDLDKAWLAYRDGRAVFDTKIENAQAEITAAQEQLWESKATLDSGYAELAAGEQKLADSKTKLASEESKMQDAGTQIAEGQKQIDAAQKKIDDGRAELLQNRTKLNAGSTEINTGLQQISAGLNEVKSGIAQIDAAVQTVNTSLLTASETEKAALLAQLTDLQNKRKEALSKQTALESQYDALIAQKQALTDSIPQLDAAEAKLNEAQKSLDQETLSFNAKKAEYEQGLAALQAGRAKLADGEAELEAARAELASGQAKYDDGVSTLTQARATLAAERIKGETDLKTSYQKILAGQAAYDKGLAQYNSKLLAAQEDIEKGKSEISKAKKDLARLKVPAYTINDKYRDLGFYQYIQNSESMDFLSYIFPVFFFLIALLVSLATMTRMVDEQRTLIGTFKALGYSNGDIAKKYIIYGSCASFVGSLIGIFAGQKVLMPIIFNAYSSSFLLKDEVPDLSPVFGILALIISLMCTGFVAFLTTRSSLKDHVSALIRPKPPKTGNRILLERFTPVWKRLSFNYKVTARNIFRYKKRMIMTIVGVAGCTALIFMGFGIQNSVSAILDKQYGELFKFDTIVMFDSDAAKKDIQNYHDDLKADPRVRAFYPARFDQGLISVPGQLDQTVYVVVPADEKAFRMIDHLRNRTTQKDIVLNDGAVITEKIADLLNLKVGDELEFEDSDETVKTIKITAIAENYIGHYIYMPVKYYEKIFDTDYQANSDYIVLKDHSNKNAGNFSENMLGEDIVLGTVNTNAASDTVKALMGSLKIIVAVIILVSSMLAIVVLYNLTNINVSERMRELCTIMVLGFYPKEVTAYVYRETMILTGIGILVGYVLGLFIHGYIVSALSSANVMMDPAVGWKSYVFSTVLTIAFSSAVMFIMHSRLKRVDMVEALKATE